MLWKANRRGETNPFISQLRKNPNLLKETQYLPFEGIGGGDNSNQKPYNKPHQLELRSTWTDLDDNV